MFGNELTDEQRQNSLMNALGIAGVAGAAKYVDKQKFMPKNEGAKSTDEAIESINKAEILAENRAQGRAFEQAKIREFEKTADNVVEQITIKTNQGTKIRVDAIGTDKSTGEIIIQEYKSSETAPLTKNQIKGFPELQSDGGNVVGKGKGIFIGGTPIPPTKVEIIRPD